MIKCHLFSITVLNKGISFQGDLPWDDDEDLQHNMRMVWLSTCLIWWHSLLVRSWALSSKRKWSLMIVHVDPWPVPLLMSRCASEQKRVFSVLKCLHTVIHSEVFIRRCLSGEASVLNSLNPTHPTALQRECSHGDQSDVPSKYSLWSWYVGLHSPFLITLISSGLGSATKVQTKCNIHFLILKMDTC